MRGILTAPWEYYDPLEPVLAAQVSPATLMEHVRTIGAWERESGSPGEAQAYDYIERALKSYGVEVERREIEAYISLPLEAHLTLPDGSTMAGLTHSFSTSVEALEAEVVDVGDARAQDLARARGKIALIRGLASPGRAWAAQQAGVLGQIHVLMDHLHNMIVTTIWGTPSPDTAARIPTTPCLSILGADGERLRALLARGPLRLRMTTRVRTGWIPIPHLVGELKGRDEDRFVLFSGHVDSWHYGAMDNGTANATMLEVARLLSSRRDALRRGIRFAFWSGHSHGRYAGSAWYADHAWRDLHARCVLHLNVDSTGARGATDYSSLHATEDAAAFAERVVADITSQQGRAKRFSRAGDQSFWGAGVPSAFMSLSGLPKQDTELSRAMERLVGSAGFPWWWHTKDDTVDKIDASVLVLDTKVYLASALRWLNAPVLPLDHTRAARALVTELETLQAAAGARFDLSPVLDAARALAERLQRLSARLAAVPDGAREAVNRALMRLSRVLVPLAYTTGDRFTHDLALPIPPLAGLQRARELATLDPQADAFKFAAAALVRERNRALHALDSAASIADELLSQKDWR
ncbi:MAG TPA: M28 family peptidase [Methylomirabilota bacterium]|nr:M28 family peptidase [Methylomirabilota bacterium]